MTKRLRRRRVSRRVVLPTAWCLVTLVTSLAACRGQSSSNGSASSAVQEVPPAAGLATREPTVMPNNASPTGRSAKEQAANTPVALGVANVAAATSVKVASSVATPPAFSSAGASAGLPPGATSEKVDFSSCQPPKKGPAADDDQGDGLIRCPLSSGLVAQQDGSSCFDVNRLFDAKGDSLFATEWVPPKGTVFVPDRFYELYRCRGAPYAVLQGGQVFKEGTSVDNPCHDPKMLRKTFLVQDIRQKKRYDDVPRQRAMALLAQIANSTACRTANE